MNSKACRKTVYDVLEARDPSSRAGNLVAGTLQILIVLNVVAVILESVPSIEQAYGEVLTSFEVVSVLLFTVEYLFRVWCAIESDDPAFSHSVWGRCRYMVTPFAIIDLIVLLPAYIGFFGGFDLRTLRIVRLLRFLKLLRYSRSLLLLSDAIREEARAVAASAFVLCILLILASSLAYLFENPSQPDSFSSIPQAMWWAVVTMTTVGYGDITPVTIPGKIIAAVVSIIGIGMVALPAGLIAAGFVNRLHGSDETTGNADSNPGMPEAGSGYLEQLLSKLAVDLQDLAVAAEMGHDAEADENHCPLCGSHLAHGKKDELRNRLFSRSG